MVGKHRVWMDNKSLQLAIDSGGYYSDADDAVIMGPRARHKYAEGLLAGCVVTCARCGARLLYEKFYRCSCTANAGGQRPPASGGTSGPPCSADNGGTK